MIVSWTYSPVLYPETQYPYCPALSNFTDDHLQISQNAVLASL